MARRKKIEVISEEDNKKVDNIEPDVKGQDGTEEDGNERIVEADKEMEKKESEVKEEFDVREEKKEDFTEEEKLRQELEKNKITAAEYRESFLRARADYENLKKRSDNQISLSLIRGKRLLIERLLEVLDNFERALNVDENTVKARDVLIGVRMIYKQLNGLLEDEGLKPVATVGSVFDPRLHEALETVFSDEYEDEEIVGEFLKGYVFKDELVRPAKVKVSRIPPAAGS